MGFQGNAGPGAPVVDQVHRTIEPLALETFRMDREDVGSGLDEPGKLLQRVGDHKMHIQREVGEAVELLHMGNPDGQIRDEMAIHHIHMDIACPHLLDGTHVTAEIHEIRRKQGWCDGHRVEHGILRFLSLTPCILP